MREEISSRSGEDAGHAFGHGPAAEAAAPPAFLPEGPFPTLTAFFSEAVGKFSDSTAIEFFGRFWSYGEIDRLSDRFAAGLSALGVRKGTRVGLCLPNSPYSVIGFFAVLKAGGTVVNFNPLYTSRELLSQIRDSGTTFMITLDLEAVYKGLGPIVGESGLKRVVVCPMADTLPVGKGMLFRLFKRSEMARIPEDECHVAYGDVVRVGDIAACPDVEIDPEDIAVLQYTGGTTGLPKGPCCPTGRWWPMRVSWSSAPTEIALWSRGRRSSYAPCRSSMFSR